MRKKRVLSTDSVVAVLQPRWTGMGVRAYVKRAPDNHGQRLTPEVKTPGPVQETQNPTTHPIRRYLCNDNTQKECYHMTDYTTALSAHTISKFVHLLRVLWRNLPELAGKVVNIIDRAVLAWEAYFIAADNLAPTIAPAFVQGFSWALMVGGAI